MLVKANAYAYNTSSVEEVVLLLDPGAQNSFITTSTTHRLRLPIYDRKERTFLTFGGHETTEVTGVVDVDLLDFSDRILKVHLTSKDIITSTQVPPRLSDADFKFLRDNRLPIPSCTSSRPVMPDILIGIDNYWDVLLQEPPVCLPSGMVLTYTRFGTVVSGNSVFLSGYRRAQIPMKCIHHSRQTMKSQGDSGHLTL
ncbi:hypothetical protein GCK32_018461 [Trichostrongylus colubriformis]|uniref:DUF1758 domain-containing protein n=1 Tax=Trichostrongylus colubriformis TaxID=6319 RepID=A0AAN8ITT3_TRICO